MAHHRSMSFAAKLGDDVVGLDTHIVMIPSPAGPVPTPVPMPFTGKLIDGLASSVYIDDKPAAMESSSALANPPHVPAGGPFQKPPANRGTVMRSSATVFIEDKRVARAGDMVKTCNDPADAPVGVVVAGGTVIVG